MPTNEGDRPAGLHASAPAGESISALSPVVIRTEKDEAVSAALPAVRTAPYDPRRHTTLLRGSLAVLLVVILAITIVASFLMAWHHEDLKLTIEQVNAFATPIVSTEVAILGTALGFYFGDRSSP